MASFTQLNDELSEVERQIIAIRLKCEEKVESENERCAQVEKRREECVEEHNKKVADAVEEYEEQIRGVQERAEEHVTRARQEKSQALQSASAATEKAEAAERQVRELERELYELRRVLDAVLLDEEKRTKTVQNEADSQVHRRLEDTNQYIRNMAKYASEIQTGVVHSVASMHEEQKDSIKDTEVASAQRSRYKELYDAAVNHGSNDISHQEFHDVKNDLSRSWYDDWVGTTRVGRRELWTDTIRLEGSAEEPLKPADTASARPVERARQFASERQWFPQDGGSPAVAWN